MKTSSKIFAWVFIALISLESCSSTTQIQSTPSGADVFIDDERVGTTPYSYSDTKIIGEETTIMLKKPGYKEYVTSITRDEEVAVGPAIAGFFFLIPWLWVMKYHHVHNYELEPAGIQPVPINPNGNLTNDAGNGATNSTNELIKFKNLLDKGLITEDDFTTMKVKILNDKYDYQDPISDQIIKLNDLYVQNLLTAEEFKSQKDKLINSK